MTGVEQIPEVELQMTCQDNDLEKDTSLDIQKKLVNVLRIKMINQENGQENVFYCYKNGF